MRTRNYDYLDTDTGKPVYSFQVKHNDKWHHVHDNGKLLLFDIEEDRNEARKQASKINPKS
jgi:glucose dehydrogenase